MSLDGLPRAKADRVIEDTVPLEGGLSCSDAACFERSSDAAAETLRGIDGIAMALSANISALASVRPRNHQDPEGIYMQLRRQTIENIAASYGNGNGDIFEILDGEISADTIYEFYDALSSSPPIPLTEATIGFMPPDERVMIEAWTGIFMRTTTLRYQMMQLAVQDPYLFRGMFDDKMLSERTKDRAAAQIHEGIKVVAAQDILRGPENSIILRMQADPEIRAYDGQSDLSLYIQEHPEASEKIKENLLCMAMGIHAMGGTTCQLLPSQGLCKLDADRIDLSRFAPLQRIVTATLDNDRHQALSRCEAWARSIKIPKVYDPIHDPTPQQRTMHPLPGAEHRLSKRAARKIAKTEEVTEDAITDHEIEQSGLQKLSVRSLGAEAIEVDLASEGEEGIPGIVKHLMDSDVISDYLRDHDNHQGLVGFMEAALRAIIAPDDITARSIERIVEVKSLEIDGHREKAYRLSGLKLMGAGGGRLASKTRILFSACNQGRQRFVTVRAVLHRSDSVYASDRQFQNRFFSP